MSDLMRLAGINSGYDTEAMIEKLMQSYQSKIDTQNKKLTKLSWKQDAYRDVISKLTSFKNKYFDILKKDSYLLSPSTFNKFKTSITNKSNPDKVGGLTVTTSSASLVGSHSFRVLQTATATKVSGNTIASNKFTLDLNKAAEFSEYTVDEDGNRNYSFALDVKVGDVAKSVSFDVKVAQDKDGNINMDDFASEVEFNLNAALEDAFGLTGKSEGDSGVTGGLNADGKERFISVEVGKKGKMEFKIGGNANVTVTEKTGTFGMAASGKSATIAPQAAVTGTNTVSVTMVGITKNVSFEGVSDTYFDSRNEAGNGDILAEYYELKVAAYQKANHGRVPTAAQLESFTYTSVQAAKDKNSKALTDALNDAFKNLGADFEIDKDGNLTNYTDFSITAVSGGTLGLTKGSASNKAPATGASLRSLGITNSDDEFSFTINGKEIKIAGTATLNDLVKAVNESGAGVTMNYSTLDGRLIVTANDMGNGGDVKIEANKYTAALGLAEDANTAMEAEVGRNSIFELDGVEIYHNSNSYEFDGTTINFEDAEVDSKYEFGISKSYDDVKQTIKDFINDYNQLVDDIYGYVGTTPARDSKNRLYDPLTDAQKEGMTEKEIENWEKKAKEGILFNDPTISSVMSNLRMVLYNTVETTDGGKFGLFNMGIKTMTWKENAHGKLELDEEAFDKAFAEHADEIEKLFTDTKTGVMGKVNNIIDNAVRSTSTNMGSLVRKAGLANTNSAKDNEIYRQMEQVNRRIQTLQARYDSKEEYWWKMFTNLEKMMSKFNEQASYMSSYLATMNGNNNSNGF